MAYGKPNRSSFLRRIKIKILRTFVSSFPLNSVRVSALRMCGFKVGQNVYIGPGLMITMPNNQSSDCYLEIGDRVAIGPRVTIILSSDANWSRLAEIIPPSEGSVVLSRDCWIGAGAIIMPNVEIGEMSVVGAGAVVTQEVPPHSVVAGVPAKVIRKVTDITP